MILEHLDDLAIYSATELAAMSSVSKATVSRLYRRLGFENSVAVRDQARDLALERRASGEPGVLADSHAVGLARIPLDAHVERETANLCATFSRLDADGPARAIATAARVVVVGFRNSYPVALHLREQLAQSRPDVVLAPQPGQSLGEELTGLGRGDVVVVVAFRRRPTLVGAMLERLAEEGVPTVLLADESAGHLAALSTHPIICPLETGEDFDSYASVMSVVSVLAGAVLAERGDAGRARVRQIAAAYEELGEVE